METNQLRRVKISTLLAYLKFHVPLPIPYAELRRERIRDIMRQAPTTKATSNRGTHGDGIRTFFLIHHAYYGGREDNSDNSQSSRTFSHITFSPPLLVLHEIGFGSWHTCFNGLDDNGDTVISGRPKSFRFGSTANNYVIHSISIGNSQPFSILNLSNCQLSTSPTLLWKVGARPCVA